MHDDQLPRQMKQRDQCDLKTNSEQLYTCILSLTYPMSRQKKEENMARIIDGELTNIVGENVRRYRKKNKMSLQALSNKIELLGVQVCRGSVSRIEDGSRTVTDIELLAISKVLGVQINELFSGM